MATKADEFDPSLQVLHSLIREILAPTLDALSTEMSTPYTAKVAVMVRDETLPKFSLSQNGFGDYEIEENTLIRIRFRRTHREDRILFSIETQHANQWRQTGFSGIRIYGDIMIGNADIRPRLKNKTIYYNSGWHGW